MDNDYLSGYYVSGRYVELFRKEFQNRETGKTEITRKYVVAVRQPGGFVDRVEIKVPPETEAYELTPETSYLFEVSKPRAFGDANTIYYTAVKGSTPIPAPRRAD